MLQINGGNTPIYFAALDSFNAIAGFSTKPPEKRAKKF